MAEREAKEQTAADKKRESEMKNKEQASIALRNQMREKEQ